MPSVHEPEAPSPRSAESPNETASVVASAPPSVAAPRPSRSRLQPPTAISPLHAKAPSAIIEPNGDRIYKPYAGSVPPQRILLAMLARTLAARRALDGPLGAKLARAYVASSVQLRYGPVDYALRTIAKIGYAARSVREPRASIAVERDVVYASPGDPAHRLDVYVPTNARRPLPVVMYVHGGGFAMLSKDTHRVMAVPIALGGHVVFNVNYRLGPWNTYPKPLEDVAAALLWVQEHCARWGGDPTRIALAGESAGGNLVTALALAHSYRRPEPFARAVFDADVALRAVVSTYGFLDLGG